jgi:glycosyltransferase involved in cell wall biosynthesis
MNNPKISVLMSAFNAEKFIKKSIKSIISQTYKNFEFLIINDGSSDKTLEIIKEFKKQDERIILFDREKRGLVVSLNEGMSLCKGQYIARMDADDIAIPERLNVQLNYLINNPSIDLVASNIIFFSDDKVTGVSDFELYKKKKLKFYSNTIGLPHPTWMVRSSFYKKFNYDSKAVSVEDQDLLIRSHQNCKFSLLKQPLLFYRIHKENNSYKYKLKQIYFLNLSRVRNTIHQRLFYYLPVIMIVFIVSCIFLIFRVKNTNIKTELNSKYQNLLHEIVKF